MRARLPNGPEAVAAVVVSALSRLASLLLARLSSCSVLAPRLPSRRAMAPGTYAKFFVALYACALPGRSSKPRARAFCVSASDACGLDSTRPRSWCDRRSYSSYEIVFLCLSTASGESMGEPARRPRRRLKRRMSSSGDSCPAVALPMRSALDFCDGTGKNAFCALLFLRRCERKTGPCSVGRDGERWIGDLDADDCGDGDLDDAARGGVLGPRSVDAATGLRVTSSWIDLRAGDDAALCDAECAALGSAATAAVVLSSSSSPSVCCWSIAASSSRSLLVVVVTVCSLTTDAVSVTVSNASSLSSASASYASSSSSWSSSSSNSSSSSSPTSWLMIGMRLRKRLRSPAFAVALRARLEPATPYGVPAARRFCCRSALALVSSAVDGIVSRSCRLRSTADRYLSRTDVCGDRHTSSSTSSSREAVTADRTRTRSSGDAADRSIDRVVGLVCGARESVSQKTTRARVE